MTSNLLRGGRPKPSVRWLIALALGFALQFAATQERIKLERPVMMDSNGPGSELFVLDASGTVHKLRVMQNGFQEYGRFSLPRQFVPADMAYASSEGQESLLIAGTEAGVGVAVRYSLDGKSLKTWKFRNISSGIDFGATARSAYVATSDSNEVYRLNLQGTEIDYVTRIDNAAKLGPVAFDESGQEVYVADVASGRIYQYSIATKATTMLVDGLSAPAALVFDPSMKRLLIADPGRRGIFTASTQSTKPAVVEFASKPLQAPYGLTLISNDRVAVADYGANSLLVYSSAGKLLFRYPPSN